MSIKILMLRHNRIMIIIVFYGIEYYVYVNEDPDLYFKTPLEKLKIADDTRLFDAYL